MYIMGIDIGLTNLAWCLYNINATTHKNRLVQNGDHRVVAFKRVDITMFKHKRVSRSDCKLRHESVCVDWVDHFLQENSHITNLVSVVIIERQPPGGHTAIEQLLYDRLRDKSILVQPISLHKFTDTIGTDYEVSKAIRVKRFRSLLDDDMVEKFNQMGRAHDVADAGVMCEWWISKNVVKPLPEIPVGFDWSMYAFATT